MRWRTHIPGLLAMLAPLLLSHFACLANEPLPVTILYTSDELGYIKPCG